jgi:hypothetical protein
MRPGSKITSERDYFEFDRRVLIDRLNALKLGVQTALTELAMIAAENVFDKRLSAKLERKAGALHRMAQRLEAVGKVVARAKFPGARKTAERRKQAIARIGNRRPLD